MCDKDGNKFSIEKYGENFAEIMLSNIAGNNCKNCIDSSDCYNCVNCINCLNCTNCNDCSNCNYCKSCNNCVNCKNCIDCNNCLFGRTTVSGATTNGDTFNNFIIQNQRTNSRIHGILEVTGTIIISNVTSNVFNENGSSVSVTTGEKVFFVLENINGNTYYTFKIFS